MWAGSSEHVLSPIAVLFSTFFPPAAVLSIVIVVPAALIHISSHFCCCRFGAVFCI
jgi:hypothetical protein